MILRLLLACAAALPLSSLAAPVFDFDKNEDKDLASFVTRPDISPPTFNIKTVDPSAVAPGYWFVAPYGDLKSRSPTRAYQPGQTGPAIYDGQGNLIWSGAHSLGDRVAFDFRPNRINGSDYLSVILNHDQTRPELTPGAGVILNSGYEVEASVVNGKGNGIMNMHEFNIVDGGNTALFIMFESVLHDISRKGHGPFTWLGNGGFQEYDIRTGEVKFSWWMLDHVNPAESFYRNGAYNIPGSNVAPYDFAHLNSVDKNADGDYLVSARYMNAIYKISGKDGSIIWQLGGVSSTFTLSGFNFSSQHDARFRGESNGKTEISFLNNASNGENKTAETSSVLVVQLNHAKKEATLVRTLERPDGQLSRLRGNAQKLPNGNYFACWSENSYITEFAPSGRRVLEAQFSSHRFVTYRAYKFEFKGYPNSKPVMKAHAYGVTPASSTTAFYVSWNGATEVAEWRFYGASEKGPVENFGLVGSAKRDGFETEFMATGYVAYAYVEAVAADGKVLGKTDIEKTEVSKKWKSDDMQDASNSFLIKNPPEARTECPNEPPASSSAESFYGWTMDLISENIALLAIGVVIISLLVLFCYSRRRKSWFETRPQI